jgi:hypothetical protein
MYLRRTRNIQSVCVSPSVKTTSPRRSGLSMTRHVEPNRAAAQRDRCFTRMMLANHALLHDSGRLAEARRTSGGFSRRVRVTASRNMSAENPAHGRNNPAGRVLSRQDDDESLPGFSSGHAVRRGKPTPTAFIGANRIPNPSPIVGGAMEYGLLGYGTIVASADHTRVAPAGAKCSGGLA